MCFHIHNRHKEVKIADRDIYCWKTYWKSYASSHGFKSLHQNFMYVFNERYDGEMKQYNYGIDEGFHSYTSYRRATRNFNWEEKSVVLCYIPRGAEYFYNPEYREYVSNAIIISGRTGSKAKIGLWQKFCEWVDNLNSK